MPGKFHGEKEPGRLPSKEAEKIFNITIQPEKEIIMILATTTIKDAIMKTLYDSVGVNTPAQGIAFSLPVDDVVGIGSSKEKKDEASGN